MTYEFRFPDIGEGIAEGEILSWKVSEGDRVSEDQTLVEVETDKAVVELPSPRAGRIEKIFAAEGDIVEVGAVLVSIEESKPAAVPAAAAQPPPDQEEAAYTGSVVGFLEEAPEEDAPLPGVRGGPPDRGVTGALGGPPDSGDLRAPGGAAAREEVRSAGTSETEILALPSVRALAKELGVDLAAIRGTGSGGRILRQDVEDVAQATAYGAAGAAAKGAPAAVGSAAGTVAAPDGGALPEGRAADDTVPIHGGLMDRDPFGPVERVPLRGVRRTMAARMTEATTKQAQVTTMDEADVTVIRRIREKEKKAAADRGVHLTYLAFVVKSCAQALVRFPRLNALLEESGEAYVLKRYCNIGIAVDTKSGLVVPNIKEADKKSILSIAGEIIELAGKAEQRTLAPADLHGGTFTITNYGAIGGVQATPIPNYPEAAILGMGRIKEAAVVRDGGVVPRLVLPLALTFDHRLIDGAEAARFMNTVVGYLEDPDLLLLEGA